MWLRFCPLRKSPKHPWLLSSLSSYSDAPHVKAKAAPLQVQSILALALMMCVILIDICCFFRKPELKIGLRYMFNVVEGELPSAVEKISSTGLDPWDLPGTVDGAQFQSHQQHTFNVSTVEDQEGEVLDYAGGSEYVDQVEVESMQATEGEVLDYSGGSEDVDQVEFESMQAAEDESEDVDQIQYHVAELTELGQRILVARGGEGGLGNVSFSNAFKKRKPDKHGNSKDNGYDPETHNADESSPSAGLPGSEAILVLELKSIADVGFVGMPNAGKSTLLGALSQAKPTVGHYEFTTLRPNLGKVNFDYFSVTVADIPGLIKGAHENRGLGHAFLRHIERTKVLANVLDLAAALDHRKGLPPWEQLKDLVLELEHHQEGLSNRPSLVVANKIDKKGARCSYISSMRCLGRGSTRIESRS